MNPTRRTIIRAAGIVLAAPAIPHLAASAAAAERSWRHGLSLFGDLRYPQGFKHFDYVNPDAPKGGAVRQIAFGTYDNFNLAVAGVKGVIAGGIGEVFDTLYYEGEWVAAGRPVVALLPPRNIKVRLFVPETRIGAIHVGQRARVVVDGVAEPLEGKVSFISPREEFTPPVIYSRQSRAKLVFMVELRFDSEIAVKLHPGQPVDAEFE